MAEPQSIKTEPFSDFPRQAYSIIGDDFCHEKNFVAKVSAKTSKSVIKIKESLSNKKDSWAVADEVKLWFDLPNNRSLYAKVKSSDYIKLHYDHGVRDWREKKYYLYGGLTCNKSLRNMALKAGVGHISEHCSSENRLKVSLQQDDSQWAWYHRTIVNHNKATFGLLTVFDITNRVFQKNNLLFGYKADDKTNVYLRAEVAGFRKQNFNIQKPESIFDSLTADVVRKIDDKSKAGFEASFDIRSKSLAKVAAVYQREYRAKEIIKVGLNNDLDITVLHKRPFYGLENIATLSVGACVSGLKNNNIALKNGFELAINL